MACTGAKRTITRPIEPPSSCYAGLVSGFRGSRAIAGALAVALLAFAAWTPWRAVNGVDNRTYVEMIAGIRDHGLPSLPNAWADRLPEAAPEFNVPAHGMLWGQYPPLHPYVAAPALALGGLAFLYKQQVLLLGAVALLAARLARRLSAHRHAPLVAGALCLLGTPMYAGSFQTFAMPLAAGLVVAAVLSAIAAARAPRAHASMRTGLLGGLAVATHLLATGMTLALVAALALVVASRERGWSARARAAGRVLGPALVGWALALAPVALLNQWRFGTPSPLHYPCRWAMCGFVLNHSLTPGGLLRFALPAAPLALLVVVGVLALRRRPARAWAWVAACFVLMLAVPAFRHSAGAMLANLWAYFVDPSPVRLAQLDQLPDGVGWLRAGNLVKGLLQSSPLVACALAAPPGLRGRRADRLIAWAPILGLFAAIAPLARFDGAFALGWPYLFSRYALYGAPLLVALATAGALRGRLRGAHLVAFAAFAAIALFALGRGRFDFELPRRLVLLWGTLAVALGAALATLLRRRWAAARRAAGFLAAAAAALSVGVSTGVDAVVSVYNAQYFDSRLEALERVAPRRFALVGWGKDTNPILALRAERDVEYVDLFEHGGHWDGVRALLDHWAEEGRPVYAVLPPRELAEWPFPREEVPLVPVDEPQGYYRVGPPVRPAR